MNARFINIIKVKGQIIDLFLSGYHHEELGSKRALAEQVTGHYYPESDIEIVSLHTQNLAYIEKE